MNNYKSWSGIRKQLSELLCEELKGRISFFLTRYHDVHNSYGRAAIRLDHSEIVTFSWNEMYSQEYMISEFYDKGISYDEATIMLKPVFDEKCIYCEMDFLDAALKYLSMSIGKALCSENLIILIFAIMDKRVGRRTLEKIKYEQKYEAYPKWVKKFYSLRFSVSL